MFITAVSLIFSLIKLRWPKTKSLYDCTALGEKKKPLIYDLKREKMVGLISTDTKFEFVFQTPIWGLDCTD